MRERREREKRVKEDERESLKPKRLVRRAWVGVAT